MPNVSNIIKKTDSNTKISEVKNKITADHDQYITTQEFNKLTLENFATRLPQEKVASQNSIANSIKKTDFNKRL